MSDTLREAKQFSLKDKIDGKERTLREEPGGKPSNPKVDENETIKSHEERKQENE